MCVRFRAAAEAGIVAARRKLRISFPIRPLISTYRATYFSLLAQRKCRQKKRHPGFRDGAAHRYPAMLERQAVPETSGCADQTVRDRKSVGEGKREAVGVDRGRRRYHKKKKQKRL